MTEVSPPLMLISPRRHGDARGWFTETYNRETFAGMGITVEFAQDNHSLSHPRYTLRGLHFQRPPRAQHKLVRCVRGRIFDVAVDLRNSSPTFGHWAGIELSAENGHQLFVPAGYGHGFLTLEADCEVVYKCSDTYSPEHDGGVAWDSAGILWPLPPGVQPELSVKDAQQPQLSAFTSPFPYDGGPMVPLS